MNCPQCQRLMIKAQATDFGEHYDYCRQCKKELKEMQAPTTELGSIVLYDNKVVRQHQVSPMNGICDDCGMTMMMIINLGKNNCQGSAKVPYHARRHSFSNPANDVCMNKGCWETSATQAANPSPCLSTGPTHPNSPPSPSAVLPSQLP